MARDGGLSHVDNEFDKNCSKFVTIEVDSSALSTWNRKMQHSKMLSPTPTRWDCQKEADMGSVPITKVREQLRRVIDDDSYTPHCVPIGPYHQSRSSQWIEKRKQCSAGFLQSLSEEHTVGGLTGVMEKLEPLARECYTSGDGFGNMTPEQSASMMLHDACYLLLFFVDYVSGNGAPPAPADDDDERLVNRNTLAIHERVTGGNTSVLDYMAMPIQELLQMQLFISRKPRQTPPMCSHLLHLVHAYFRPMLLPAVSTAMSSDTGTGRWRRAVEYRRYANVQLMRRVYQDDVESSVLDVQLERGRLWIPRLRITSNTWTILHNLMALEEQAHRRPVTAYCLFMSQLACTSEDVQVLRRAGIVDHFLDNDEQVSKDFAGLCNGVVMEVDDLERNYLKPMWHQLEKRCDSRAQRFMGWFRHGHNWEIAAAFLVALIVIACQVTQTFYAITGRGR
ncbi:hypothetical protein ACQ4PT_039248 [Festuca glaucescens]